MDPLEIVLRVVDEQARQQMRQFADQARQVVQQIGRDQEQQLGATSSLERQLREARIKGIQDGYKAEEKAAQTTADKLIAGAKQQQGAFLKLSNELREARIKGVQDAAKADEEAARQVSRNVSSIVRGRLKEIADQRKADAKQDDKDDQAYVEAVKRRLAAEKALEKEKAREILENTRRRIAEEQAETKASVEEGKRLAQEYADARKKGEDDAAGVSKARAAATKATRDREFKERMDQLRERLARTKGASDEEIRIFEAETARRRAAYKEAYKYGEMSAEDLLRFEREAAKEREVLHGKEKSAILSIADAYTYLRAQAMVVQAIKEVWASYAQSVKDARDYTRDIVKDTEDFVVRHREHFAMLGEEATPTNAANLLMRASGANLRGEEYAESEKQFANYAASYVDLKAEEGDKLAPGKKFTKAQAQRLLGAAATYGVGARGLKPEEAMKAFGAVAATSRPGATDEEILGNYAKVLIAGQNAIGETSPAIGQIAQGIIEDLGPDATQKDLEESIILTRLMSEGHPGMEATYRRGLLRGMRQLNIEAAGGGRRRRGGPRLAELGIKRGARPFEFMEQFLAKRDEAVNAAVARGEDRRAASEAFVGRYFDQEHEFQGAMAVLDRGFAGGIDRAKGEIDSVNAATVAEANRRFGEGYVGKKLSTESATEAAKFRIGASNAFLAQLRRDARLSIAEGGEMGIPESLFNAYVTHGSSAVPGISDRAEMEERRLVASRLRNFMVGHRNDPRVRGYLDSVGYVDPSKQSWWNRPLFGGEGQTTFLNPGMTPEDEFNRAARVMGLVVSELQKQTKIMEAEQKRGGAPNAAAAVPRALPNGAAPMQNGGARGG